MVTKDIEIVKEIFSQIDEGINDNYDSFIYEAEVYDVYMEEQLIVEMEGQQLKNADTDINGAVLYDLIQRLKESSLERGENWKSFRISYQNGGQVKTNFKY